MPGSRSKRNRSKARKQQPVPTPRSNSFEALAAPEEGELQEPDEEEEQEQEQEQEQEPGGEAEGATAAATTAETPSASPGGAGGDHGSSLAEDLLAAPSTLPPQDPVRIETAACIRRCMLDGTTPPAWVLELVLPGATRPRGVQESQIQEVSGGSLPQNLDVVFQGVQSALPPATPIQQSSSSDSNRTSPPNLSHPAPHPACTSSAVAALPAVRTSSAVAAPPAARTSSAVDAPQPARTSSAVETTPATPTPYYPHTCLSLLAGGPTETPWQRHATHWRDARCYYRSPCSRVARFKIARQPRINMYVSYHT